MLYPISLKWRRYPIWVEAETEKEARGLEYAVSIGSVLLESYETNNEPINLKGQSDG